MVTVSKIRCVSKVQTSAIMRQVLTYTNGKAFNNINLKKKYSDIHIY